MVTRFSGRKYRISPASSYSGGYGHQQKRIEQITTLADPDGASTEDNCVLCVAKSHSPLLNPSYSLLHCIREVQGATPVTPRCEDKVFVMKYSTIFQGNGTVVNLAKSTKDDLSSAARLEKSIVRNEDPIFQFALRGDNESKA
jgi:hypothetical protein